MESINKLTSNQITDAILIFASFDLSKSINDVANCAKAIQLSLNIEFKDAVSLISYLLSKKESASQILFNNN